MTVTDQQLRTLLADEGWTPINLNTLPAKPPVQPDLAHTGLIYPGKRHVFSGPPESAKTLAAYCILIQNARCGATGILIDFEMGAYDARQRLQELGATADELDRIPYLEPDQRATTDRITPLADLQPTIVVIDAAAGAYNLEGLDDNKRGDVEKISHLYVETFRRHGIATITIDHVVKNTETRGRFAIGSERKLGGADIHLGFDTIKPMSRGTNGHYKLIVHKDRGGYLKRGHLADFKLESDPETHEISWAFVDPEPATAEAGYFRPTHLMEKVSLDLEIRSEPVTRNRVCEALGGTKDYILKAINALIIEGYIQETEGSNRSKLLTSTHRFRENNPSGSGGSAGGSEPLNPNNEQGYSVSGSAVVRQNDDLAQPSGGSVVRQWFGSGSANHRGSGGSVVRGSLEPEPPRPLHTDHPEPLGWFGANGHLEDSYIASLDDIAPDPDDTPF